MNVLDIPRFQPVQDSLDFVRGHPESLGGQDIAEIFNSIGMELTLIRTSIKSVFPKASEDFPDMLPVLGGIIRIDEDVIKVDDNRNVNHVGKDVVHKTLESGRSVSETERHNQPFKRPVASPECGLPFVSVGDADKMIGMPEVDFGVNPGFPGGIQKISK